MFKLSKAAFCRETGRIFPNAITWYGKIKVDWTFLRKRYPGHWISWGSLSPEQKEEFYRLHDGFEGFQTEDSSPNPAPNRIEERYVYTIPGPLYVDLSTKAVMGWQVVTDTDFEVLIVQLPRKI